MTFQDAYDRLPEDARRAAFIKMHKALDAIASGADPAFKPGHVSYISKAEIKRMAETAMPETE